MSITQNRPERPGADGSTAAPGPVRPRAARPPYERPVLAVIAAACALVACWDLDGRALSPYAPAAVRSMAHSWKAFLFGALDPASSLTVDKIPGALWPQALSVRLFGFHPWAVFLPQAVFAVLTVLVLHRAVRRHAGPPAALLAAAAMACTPVAAALAHFAWPDTLLTLLLVLAADATLRAVDGGRLGPLLMAGVWVGLAVHAKMLEAWGVLPALAAVHLLAAPTALARRLRDLALAGVVTAAVSCAWMAVVWAVPAEDRPYVDATSDNDPFSMVFDYNGLDRFNAQTQSAGTYPYRSGLFDAVFGLLGTQVMWLFPAAAAAVVWTLLRRRRAGRTDPARAGVLLWAGWLGTYATVFSVAQINHVAYAVVLGPPLAALAGVGLAGCAQGFREGIRERGRRAWALPVLVAATAAWAVVLTRRAPGFRPWLPGLVTTLAVLAVLLLLGLLLAVFRGPLLSGTAPGGPLLRRSRERLAAAGVVLGVAAALAAPATWTVSTAAREYTGISTSPEAGPLFADWEFVDAPPEVRAQLSAAAAEFLKPENLGQVLGPTVPAAADLAALRFAAERSDGRRYALAVSDAVRAADLIADSGASVLPMGGFTGRVPFPDREHFLSLLRAGELRYVLAVPPTQPGPPTATTANLEWVAANCAPVDPAEYGVGAPAADAAAGPGGAAPSRLYDCAGRAPAAP
ncbi:glycosyltransferase family 39 protein [Kitasatospora sp. CM 4170]|uniref:ArnT family glycosyltransferase n=1 Tax=Kitasatospora aburaviensis TaxID=67265 RepID=A0ABW1ETK3_9ACTN|nr:glycosyltransferase family 39 protein [Kitasatospora sp. CM 4170]WNM44782.1 glycosyltransferase family 39 protein [Kitasatospora sp. CM 4170]